MGCYHFHLTQLSRGHGQSAIASAAYRSGEKLYNSYYGETSDYTRKGGVILSEIHLPDHAPERFKDRETLWNELEWEEPNKRAQLAHSFDIAFMNEFSMGENIELARRFVREQLVSRGMIVDLAIHDPKRSEDKEPNPHMHIMVPIRPLKKDGTWDVKQKKIPILKEDGTPILNKNGKPKMKAVPVNDWSSKETLMELRKAWANLCNELYEEKGLPQRVDWRSYEELGVNQIPTVHEGPTVRAMEAKGMETALGSLNRMIRKFNQMLQDAKELLWKAMFQEGQLQEKMLLTKKPTIAEYLMEYYEQRNEVAETFAYLAACIANALIEQEVSVKMLNFSHILNSGFETRNELLEDICRCSLLIIDDFGSERETEYGLETIHSVLDARYNCGKPMIVTTNLPLQTINHPTDVMHKKIYDRLKNCVPIQFTGESFRKDIGNQKKEEFRQIVLNAHDSF